jgi:hypothetical protein
MIILYPISRSVGYLLIGAFAIYFTVMLIKHSGMYAGAAGVMGCVAVYWGIYGLLMRKKRPLELTATELTYFKGAAKITINRADIEKVWLNSSGIDKRVSVKTKQLQEHDIPVPYGLSALAKKLNTELSK